MASPPPTWQFACAAYIPLATANLSVFGSSLIIYSILRGFNNGGTGSNRCRRISNINNVNKAALRKKLSQPQNRILFAMSCYDVLYSIVKAWTFLLAPKGFGVPGAQGNLRTCALQGFFIQLAGHAEGACSALLSLYYYLVICRGWKPHEFTTRVERVAHVLIFLVFLVFAIIGVSIKLYNPVFGFCYIGSFPPGCERGEGSPPCERFPPHQLGLLYEIFAQMWVQGFFVIVFFSQFEIWRKIRANERRKTLYDFRASIPGQISPKTLQMGLRKQSASVGSKCADPNGMTINSYSAEALRVSVNSNSAEALRLSVNSNSAEFPTDSSDRPSINGSSVNATKFERQKKRHKLNRQKMVAIQSTLYVLSFTLCWIGPTVFHLVGWIANYQSFAFVLVLVIFTPLMGFWNAIVYARPSYIKLRKKERDLSRFQVLTRVFFGESKCKKSVPRTGKMDDGDDVGAEAGGVLHVLDEENQIEAQEQHQDEGHVEP